MHLPIELLYDLNGSCLLALQPQAVHRVCQVDGVLCSDLLDEAHAAIEISVDAQHQGTIGDGLDQLGYRYLVRRQEDDGWDSSSCAIG